MVGAAECRPYHWWLARFKELEKMPFGTIPLNLLDILKDIGIEIEIPVIFDWFPIFYPCRNCGSFPNLKSVVLLNEHQNISAEMLFKLIGLVERWFQMELGNPAQLTDGLIAILDVFGKETRVRVHVHALRSIHDNLLYLLPDTTLVLEPITQYVIDTSTT